MFILCRSPSPSQSHTETNEMKQAYTFTPTDNFELQVNRTRMLLDCGRKLEYLGKKANKVTRLNVEREHGYPINFGEAEEDERLEGQPGRSEEKRAKWIIAAACRAPDGV